MGERKAGKHAVMEVPVLVQIYGVVMNMFMAFVVVPVSTGIVFASFYNVHRKVKAQWGRVRSKRQLCSELRVLVRFLAQLFCCGPASRCLGS